VDHQFEAVVCGLAELFGAEHAFEENDGGADTGGSQGHSFFESRHGEAVGIGERKRRGDQTVSVSIGFNNRHHLNVLAHSSLNDLKIFSKSVQINGRPSRSAAS
jgi:hypothetical protein